jgi:hypothetical protein
MRRFRTSWAVTAFFVIGFALAFVIISRNL